jgi:hypothetical protein
VDDNCDGQIDEGLDTDGDGIADCFDANLEIIRAHVTGGFGGTQRHFYIGDMVKYRIKYEITGGDPNAQYKVVGLAFPSEYKSCSKKKRKARAVDYVGSGEHILRFRKRVPSCVNIPSLGTWTDVRWRIKVITEDGTTLLDRDVLFTDEAFAIHSN